MKQTSLYSTFEVEKTTTTVVKYKMTVPLKKCKKCKKWKPVTDFHKQIKHSGKKSYWMCKDCYRIYMKEWYDNNTDHVQDKSKKWVLEHKDDKHFIDGRRVTSFLTSGSRKKRSGYLHGQGICLICGSTEPLVLVNHHIVPWDSEFVFSLCANCHEIYRSGGSIGNKQETHMLSVLKAIDNSKFLWSWLEQQTLGV